MPAADYTVVVFPEDATKWSPPSRYVKSARPDQQGLIKIVGLPPDDRYLAVAVDYLEEGGAADPEFLDLIKPGFPFCPPKMDRLYIRKPQRPRESSSSHIVQALRPSLSPR